MRFSSSTSTSSSSSCLCGQPHHFPSPPPPFAVATQQQLTAPKASVFRTPSKPKGKQVAAMVLPRSNRRMVWMQATADASEGKISSTSSDNVQMVDPLEAKRLAAEQMEAIQSREKFKRLRQIEAINGAWAMIGLTAGLVIEGKTGKSILAQLLSYWDSVFGLFGQ